MNSRTLTSVSDDPEDLEALTPNHFLLGLASPATSFIPDTQRYTALRRVFRAYANLIWTDGTEKVYHNGMRVLKGTKKKLDNLKSTIWLDSG